MNSQPITSESGALARFLKATFTAGLLAASVLFLSGHTSQAGSATWKSTPATADWNTATNWSPATIPNGTSDTATFASSNTTGVSLSAETVVDSILFNSGASAFTVTVPVSQLGLKGAGITNNSGTMQNFVINPTGVVRFFDSATAGSVTTFTISGGVRSGAFGGIIEFSNASTASSATFINVGATVNNALGGVTEFEQTAAAGNATLIANGGSAGGLGGEISFISHADGGHARVEAFGNGYLDISGHFNGVTIGSLEGDGFVFLGGNNLNVGRNKVNTTFSGVIEDGGHVANTGGSLMKIGQGKLTLTGANTYTGGTTVKTGTLFVSNTSGFGTGSGAVQVEGGTLGGTGTIAGAVTVGTGSTSGAR